MQNMTPAGGHRGSVLERSGGDVVLDTGTDSLEWKRPNELPCGPNGKNGVTWASDAKTEVPSVAWVVTTRRGEGKWEEVDIFTLFEVRSRSL